MFEVVVRNVHWVKGTAGLEQGFKNNYVPPRAFAGSNGTFVCTTPAELRLELISSSGERYTKDIIRTVRNVNGWTRLSENRVALIKNKLCGKTIAIENGEIIGLESLVAV